MGALTHQVGYHFVEPSRIFLGEGRWRRIGECHGRGIESQTRRHVWERRGELGRGRRAELRDPIAVHRGLGEMLQRPFGRVEATLGACFLCLGAFGDWGHGGGVVEDDDGFVTAEELDAPVCSTQCSAVAFFLFG